MLGGNHERDEVVERLAADLAEARATIALLRERIAMLEAAKPPRAIPGQYACRPYVPGE